jgi:hypothetical protein
MPVDENGLILGMQLGEVVDNADPLRLGRVRVRIAGLIEPQSSWCWPLGFGGHRYDVPLTAANYAALDPPQNRPGDDVAVWFRDGDVDQAWYMPAHGGMPDGVTPEVPEPIKTMAIEDAHLVKALEFGNWVIVADDRTGSKGIRIEDKVTGEIVLEYDGVNQSLKLKAIAGLTLAADGGISVEGLTVTLTPRGVAREVESRPETI